MRQDSHGPSIHLPFFSFPASPEIRSAELFKREHLESLQFLSFLSWTESSFGPLCLEYELLYFYDTL